MKKIFYSLLISIIALITLSSCYAMSDDGVMSSIDYNVIISNGYPYYRDVRVIYYPHYYNCYRYYRPLTPNRRNRHPHPRFDRFPQNRPKYNRNFGNGERRPHINNNHEERRNFGGRR